MMIMHNAHRSNTSLLIIIGIIIIRIIIILKFFFGDIVGYMDMTYWRILSA